MSQSLFRSVLHFCKSLFTFYFVLISGLQKIFKTEILVGDPEAPYFELKF